VKVLKQDVANKDAKDDSLGWSEDYGNLEMISEFKDCESMLDALNTERSQTKKGAGASPPPKYVERARKFETQNE